MKSTVLIFLLFLAEIHSAYCYIVPDEKFKPGQNVEIKYTPSNDLACKTVESAVAYTIADPLGLPIASEIDIDIKNDIIEFKIPTTTETKLVLVKFSAGDKVDVVIKKLFADDDKLVSGSMAALANLYASTGSIVGIERDNQQALSYLMNEFELNPDTKKEYLRLYARLAKVNKVESGISEVKSLVAEINKNKKSSEEQLIIARTALQTLGAEDEVKVLEERIVKSYPKGKTALNIKAEAFSNEKDVLKKEKLFNSIKSQIDQDMINWMASSLASQFGSVDRAKFESYSSLIKSPTRLANTYNSLAWILSGESIKGEAGDLEYAAGISLKSLKLVKNAIGNSEDKPVYLTNAEWSKRLMSSYGMYADTYALIQYKRAKYEDAYNYQGEYIKYSFPDAEATLRYAMYAEKVNGKENALDILSKAIVDGNSSKEMKDKFVGLLSSYAPNESAELTVKLLESQSKENLRNKMKDQILDLETPKFTLKDLEGNEVSTESLLGKIVIIDFWATWCGPCIASFPGMQNAVDHYKDDNLVKFVFINSWENGKVEEKQDNVSKFIEKKGYRFHVLMDTDDKVISSFKVEGIPTKFVIGPDGNIKFKKIGGGDADKLIDELHIMIDLVRSDANEESLSMLDR